jgi:hypothetical protein
MKINIFEYIVMRKMIFSREKPPKSNKIKKHDVPDLHRSLYSKSLDSLNLQFNFTKQSLNPAVI